MQTGNAVESADFFTHAELLPWIVLLPLLGAAINGLFGKRMSKGAVTFFGVGSVVAAFVLSCIEVSRLAELESGALASTLWTWFSSFELHIDIAFSLDQLSAVLLLVVTGVGSLIHIFSIGYMRSDEGYWKYFSYLNLFMFSMLLLILGKNLLVLFVGWEGVGLCSYLLIGFWFKDMPKAEAGQKAFVTNRVGDLAFLIGAFILLFYSQGTLDFHELKQTAASMHTDQPVELTIVCLLFLVGACGKSAQIPLYVWLPDAMAGPTPVSALIHAATMVTAGVYLMVRTNFMFSASETAMTVVAIVGAATALMAATIALVQNDIKKVLAYSTVSQIGFMVAAVGVGGYVAAVFHLMTHAFFKACLFLGAGSVIHALHHEQDIRKMGALKKKLKVTRWSFLISCLAIAGIPLFSGFFSKDEILFTAFTTSHWGADPKMYVFGMLLLAAFCTAFYMFRLYFLTFEGEYRGDKHTWDHAHEETVMNIPLMVLGFLAAAGGLLGLPHFTHAHFLHGWLQPVLGFVKGKAPDGTPLEFIQVGGENAFTYVHDTNTELMLMGLSVLVAAIGILLAWRLYKRPASELPKAPVDAWWHRLLSNKYYVDEFYDATIVRPLRGTANLLHKVVDVGLIDGLLVKGPAKTLGKIGDGLRMFQNGDVQAYATVVVVGMAAALFFIV